MSIPKLSREFKVILDSIKDTIAGIGICTIGQFKDLIGEADPTLMLAALHEEGIMYVKTEGQVEVLGDVRLMAVAMLVAYSHPKYAKTNKVLDYLKFVQKIQGKSDPLKQHILNELCPYMYSQLGHNFTIGKVAERAVIDLEDSVGSALYLYERSVAALTVLAADDVELSAVYRMAKKAFDIANGWSKGDVYGMHRKDAGPDSTFNHYHRLAAMMINKHKPRK